MKLRRIRRRKAWAGRVLVEFFLPLINGGDRITFAGITRKPVWRKTCTE